MSESACQKGMDNSSNQCNPNNPEYKGHQPGYQGKGDKADLDNHCCQLNPNNPARIQTSIFQKCARRNLDVYSWKIYFLIKTKCLKVLVKKTWTTTPTSAIRTTTSTRVTRPGTQVLETRLIWTTIPISAIQTTRNTKAISLVTRGPERNDVINRRSVTSA